MIECRSVSVESGDFVLRDVSFTVPHGAHALLTGPTASGKTTLLETIAGALIPTTGSIFINGTDVTRLLPESRGVALVHQRGYLFPHLDVRANVAYGARRAGIVDDLLARFGIAPLADRSIHRLSGGERQLVALCRALASERSVLLLDEPFSALDRDLRAAATTVLGEICAARAVTVLHATHDTVNAGSGLEMSGGSLRVVA